MGNERMSRPLRDQPIHFNLPRDDYERMRYYLMKRGHMRGGVTAFIQEAVSKHLRDVELEPTTFEESFMAMWRRPPRAYDKWCCYGAAIDVHHQGVVARQVGRFTIDELKMHHDTSQWNERTYVLVEEQIKQHRASGIPWNEQRPLIAPVPSAVIGEAPPPRPSAAVTPSGQPFAFDPQTRCFLAAGGCPQVEACLEAGACCADPPQEEEGL